MHALLIVMKMIFFKIKSNSCGIKKGTVYFHFNLGTSAHDGEMFTSDDLTDLFNNLSIFVNNEFAEVKRFYLLICISTEGPEWPHC